MNKPDITIIIPCHQLDERFEKALGSAQWAREVLVIDQNSQIEWEKLHKRFSFQVIEHLHLKSFSEMKNQAMHSVNTEWVFFLDSDEFISSELAEEITTIIEGNVYQAMRIKRVDFFLKRALFHGETRSAFFTRSVKTKMGEWQGKVHEELVTKEGEIYSLISPLYHEPHLSIHAFVTKVNQYTSLLALQTENAVILKFLLLPLGKFFYTFVVKQGFLDGYRGLIYSFMMSIHSSVVRVKRYEDR